MQRSLVLGTELSRVVLKDHKLRLRYKLESTVERDEFPVKYAIGDDIVEPELISDENLGPTHRAIVQGGVAIVSGRLSRKTLFAETWVYDLNIEPLPVAIAGKTISWDITEQNLDNYVEASDPFFQKQTTYYEVVRHNEVLKSGNYGRCSNISIRIYSVDLGWTKIFKFSFMYLALWMWIVIGFYQGTLVGAISASVIVLSVSVARMIDDGQLQESVFFSFGMALSILCELAGHTPFFLWLPLVVFGIILLTVVFHLRGFIKEKAAGKSKSVIVLSGHYPSF